MDPKLDYSISSTKKLLEESNDVNSNRIVTNEMVHLAPDSIKIQLKNKGRLNSKNEYSYTNN